MNFKERGYLKSEGAGCIELPNFEAKHGRCCENFPKAGGGGGGR